MKKFVYKDHTADLIIEARGLTLKKAIENCAKGLFSLTANQKLLSSAKKVKIKVKASSLEELVSLVLDALVAESDARELFFKEFKVEKIDGEKISLTGTALGCKMTPEAGELHVKAVTHHETIVKKTRDGWLVRVLLDI
ncbi:archease [Candidatus Micrarchaeota archaeon]|nr:archease [Candidatus Micrarchaeota archaeon]